MKNTMLHMKLNSAVSVFAVAAAFSVLLPPSAALAGICFLPDCQDEDVMQGDINMNINSDTEWCEKEDFTYYASGKCPQYEAQVGKCSRDDRYLKCDPVKWCTDNGYNTQTCSLPSFVDGQCPNGKPYYKQCKEDRPRACREAGYVNSCSSGRLYYSSGRCQWDSSYGTCCSASPSIGCPTNYKVTCDSSRGTSGADTCGYPCYRCCSDECSRGSKNYTGSYATTTECGSSCYNFRSCPSSASTSYHGSSAGYDDNGKWCGNYCSDSCSSGSRSPSCAWDEKEVSVGSSECGTCYKCTYNTDCNATDQSCSGGWCNSTNSCGKCTSCGYPCTHSAHVTCQYGCASTCPCCSSCKTCNSGTEVISCTKEFDRMGNTTPHCHNRYIDGSGYNYVTLNCNSIHKVTKTLANGTTQTSECTVAARVSGHPDSFKWQTGDQDADLASCNAERAKQTCTYQGYDWCGC